ncbi:hypothetical protein HDE_02353 [Halotydeus destructor]|nr:hypothetical protein HDE_02353 [Halotydeus destructor]
MLKQSPVAMFSISRFSQLAFRARFNLNYCSKSHSYDVAVVLDPSCKGQDYVECRDYVISEVMKEQLSVYSLPPEKSIDLNDSLKYLDDIGVHYTIILGSRLLKLGDLDLRDRDTKLSERVHSSNIIQKLRLYIKSSDGNHK